MYGLLAMIINCLDYIDVDCINKAGEEQRKILACFCVGFVVGVFNCDLGDRVEKAISDYFEREMHANGIKVLLCH